MTTDPLIPLLLPLLAWPVSRLVTPRVPPRAASWLLTGTCLILAGSSTAALALLAFSGLSLLPVVAEAGHWSPEALRTLGGVDVPVSIGAGAALAVLAVLLVRTNVHNARWIHRVSRELDEHSPHGGVVLLPGREPVAFAVPGRGGRIAVSGGMLAALNPHERAALLAHERAHLSSRHHVFLLALTLSSTLNPLLHPLCSAAGFALERWADEAAAARVGDRTVVAHAVAKAALAARPHGGFALAATGGPVPRRVTALLERPAGLRRTSVAVLSAAVLGVAALSAATVLDSAADLHDGIELAQAGR
ncbi:M56 family metallopeptidase [Amycolatopsis australiensis]|uniref:Peptidase family M48 n=1 Tax=Amycolatopsis australiensis TaxID=546364 RepID=A0A1K1RMS8_9PSEU|nr:M56 family metallopeptidase [Amycolatopsis australiensis]SFW73092.1 Peptidase family M48 [Amycolatopsis australiensis]